MNWIDFVVIGVIVGYAFIGYAKGLVYSVFKVASFFVAAFISMQLYPAVSKLLISTFHLDQTIRLVISDNVSKILTSEQIQSGVGAEGAKSLLGSWQLPPPMQEMVVKNLSVEAGKVAGNIVDGLSQSFSVVAVNIISMIIIFMVVSFLLIFVRGLLEGAANLPFVRQINRLGGTIFGMLEGVIIVYIACAVLTLFASSQELKYIFESINTSSIAKGFYTHNFILMWAFGGK